MAETLRKSCCSTRRKRLQMSGAREAETDRLENFLCQVRIKSTLVDHVRDHHAVALLETLVVRRDLSRYVGDGQVVVDQEYLCLFVAHKLSFPLQNTYRCKRDYMDEQTRYIVAAELAAALIRRAGSSSNAEAAARKFYEALTALEQAEADSTFVGATPETGG